MRLDLEANESQNEAQRCLRLLIMLVHVDNIWMFFDFIET